MLYRWCVARLRTDILNACALENGRLRLPQLSLVLLLTSLSRGLMHPPHPFSGHSGNSCRSGRVYLHFFPPRHSSSGVSILKSCLWKIITRRQQSCCHGRLISGSLRLAGSPVDSNSSGRRSLPLLPELTPLGHFCCTACEFTVMAVTRLAAVLMLVVAAVASVVSGLNFKIAPKETLCFHEITHKGTRFRLVARMTASEAGRAPGSRQFC